LGQVVAAVAVNGALLGFGYSADNSSLSTLTDTQLNTMYYLGTIIPAALFGLMGLVLLIWYPLSKKKVADLQVLKEEKLKEAFKDSMVLEGAGTDTSVVESKENDIEIEDQTEAEETENKE
ncbi:MAG: hypothetical protein K5765_05190, partial [Clostridia bacterium]|nr:hypothetical protein [Clostridia bacterium]